MLSERAVALYLYTCRRDAWSLEEASTDLGIRLQDLSEAQAELVGRRLLAPWHAGDGALAPTAPDVALAELVDEDERRIHELRASVDHHRRDLMALLPSYREARRAVPGTGHVEVLEEPEAVQRLLLDVTGVVEREVLVVEPTRGAAAATGPGRPDWVARDRDLLSRGVERRTLYHDRRRGHVPTQRSVAELEPLGGAYRTVPLVPFRLVVVDRGLALVSRHRDEDDHATLVLRSPELVGALAAAFDATWDVATPFAPTGEEVDGDDGAPGLTAVQMAVLQGLASGLTDEVLAGRLDIGVRTCRRHVAAVFEALGAESRYQAGVLAVHRGWLPASAGASGS